MTKSRPDLVRFVHDHVFNTEDGAEFNVALKKAFPSLVSTDPNTSVFHVFGLLMLQGREDEVIALFDCIEACGMNKPVKNFSETNLAEMILGYSNEIKSFMVRNRTDWKESRERASYREIKDRLGELGILGANDPTPLSNGIIGDFLLKVNDMELYLDLERHWRPEVHTYNVITNRALFRPLEAGDKSTQDYFIDRFVIEDKYIKSTEFNRMVVDHWCTIASFMDNLDKVNDIEFTQRMIEFSFRVLSGNISFNANIAVQTGNMGLIAEGTLKLACYANDKGLGLTKSQIKAVLKPLELIYSKAKGDWNKAFREDSNVQKLVTEFLGDRGPKDLGRVPANMALIIRELTGDTKWLEAIPGNKRAGVLYDDLGL